jgi:hypothetical protein
MGWGQGAATYNEIVILLGSPTAILSDEEVKLLEGYLAHSNGIADKLPADHPHKKAAPMRTPRPWTPADLPGVALWMDPSDEVTVTVLPDNTISQLVSKDPGARVCTRDGDGDRAWTYVRNAQNGLAIASVPDDGTKHGGRFLEMGAPVSHCTLIACNRWISGAPNPYNMLHGSSTGPDYQGAADTNATVVFDDTAATAVSPSRQGLVIRDYGVATNNPSRVPGGRPSLYVIAGDTPAMCNGFRGSENSRAVGDMCELILTTGKLTTEDMEKAEGYLAHKWGIAGNLPDAHPYKSELPMA